MGLESAEEEVLESRSRSRSPEEQTHRPKPALRHWGGRKKGGKGKGATKGGKNRKGGKGGGRKGGDASPSPNGGGRHDKERSPTPMRKRVRFQ